ncbi:MAG: cation:proton antiporter [Pseudomonadota bacterium]
MDAVLDSPEILLLAVMACVFAYALLSNAVAKTIVTLPMIFTAVGYISSRPLDVMVEPAVLNEGARLLAEVTLVLVLFSDASRVRFQFLRRNFNIALRMLAAGLPLTVCLGTAVVFMINPASGLAMALLTAAVLTPTDAALGQTVVSSEAVPERLRQTINVESGLNDGLALPFVLLGAILASAGLGASHTEGLAKMVALQVTLGPLTGIALGWGFAYAMSAAQDRNLMAEASGGVAFLVVAFSTFFVAELIGGNGFIAAFVAGMVFGNSYKSEIHFISEFMEGVGQLLTIFAFLMFGAVLLPDGLQHMGWKAVVIAVLFLTVVRILPIMASLTGTGLELREKLFLGWFGPRGLASILFTLIIIDEFDFAGEQELLACVSMTVFLSILAHGVSAAPLSKRVGGA